MAYQYCGGCGNRLHEPTTREIIDGDNYQCPDCNHEQSHLASDKDALYRMLERIEIIEKKMGIESEEHDSPNYVEEEDEE